MKSTFKISKEDSDAFKYLGIELQHTKNGIYVSLHHYSQELKEIDLSPERRKARNSTLTENETTQLRSAVGKLNWLAGQSRPDLSFDVCDISTKMKTPTVDLILQINKLILKAKYNNVFLYYPILDLNDLKIRCFTDASYGNLSNGGSQGGFYTELVDKYNSSPIEWQSKRLRRTPHSTLAAETIAMVEGMEAAYSCSMLLSEILYDNRKEIPVEMIIDNYSLFQSVHSTTSVTDRRLRIEMAILREAHSRSDFKLKWAKAEYQLSDCLTKRGSDPRKLIAHITGKEVV